jgi:hypothetical protein
MASSSSMATLSFVSWSIIFFRGTPCDVRMLTDTLPSLSLSFSFLLSSEDFPDLGFIFCFLIVVFSSFLAGASAVGVAPPEWGVVAMGQIEEREGEVEVEQLLLDD